MTRKRDKRLKLKQSDIAPSAVRESPVRRSVQAKTDGQQRFIDAIRQKDIVICVGPAGTGKSHLSVALAVEFFGSRKIGKIIISRPVVGAGTDLGALPGSFEEKIHPYLLPLFDELKNFISVSELKHLKENELFEIAPLEYMRGRTLKNAFVILDEAQNATLEQLRMILTRIGEGSKLIINGDLRQSDLRKILRGGLGFCVERLVRMEGDGLEIITLDERDIVRHPLVGKILERLEEK